MPGVGEVSAEVGAPDELATLLGLGFGERLRFERDFDQAAPMFHPIGGMDAIPRALADAAAAATTRLGQQVTGARNTGSGVEVTVRVRSGRTEVVRADFGVCALPPHLAAAVDTNWDDSVVDALGEPVPFTTGKIGLEYDRRFWETDDGIFGGTTHCDPSIRDIWYPSTAYLAGGGVIVGAYPFGQDADRFSRLSPPEREELAVSVGESIHGSVYRDELRSDARLAARRLRVGAANRHRPPRTCAERVIDTFAFCVPSRSRMCEHLFVRDEASILHADLDSFYASVEQRDDPALRGRPVIVGMGVVLAASYEAKAFGVRTAMGGRQALRLCPSAVTVPPRMRAYSDASKAVFAVFDDTTPLVEGLSIDEAFLDVGGLRRVSGTPLEIAARLRADVRERVGLPITVGVARTKFLAKVASGVAKPDGLLVVPPGAELDFLHPLPVERLWGVGAKTAAKLHDRGITTVADVARVGEGPLVSILGPFAGRHLHALAHNRDPRRVEVGRRRRSIGSQHAIGRSRHGPRSQEEIDTVLVGIVDRVTRRLRAAQRVGRTVVLRLRFDDFVRVTRSHTIGAPTAETEIVLAAARDLLTDAMPMIDARGVTLVGLAVANLDDDDAVQLTLPFDRHAGGALDAALDGVRERFGSSAVTRAVLLGRDHGPAVPLLPD